MGKRKSESQQVTSTGEEAGGSSASKKSKQSTTSNENSTSTSTSSSNPIQVAGEFYSIPLQFQSSNKSSAVHHIYARPHSNTSTTNSNPSLPSDRTLFVANLPLDTTQQHLKSLFSKAGVVQKIKMQLARNVGWIQKEEDEEEEEDEDLDDEEEEQANAAGEQDLNKKGGRKGRGKGKGKELSNNKSGPPKIINLPSLDPRSLAGGNPFLPTSSSAHVIFLDASSLTRCLSLIQSNDLPKAWKDPREGLKQVKDSEMNQESEASNLNQPRKKIRTANEALNHHSNKSGQSIIPPLGLDFFLEDFRSKRPSLSSIKEYSDSTIANYEWRRANPTKAGTAGSRIPGVSIGPDGELLDADGFTIVQSGGKYGKAKGENGANVGMVRNRKTKDDLSDASRNRKKKTKELEDFYRFQMREKKRERECTLME